MYAASERKDFFFNSVSKMCRLLKEMLDNIVGGRGILTLLS